MHGMQIQSLVRELRSHMPGSNWAHAQLESLCIATKPQYSQTNEQILKDKMNLKCTYSRGQ